VQAALVPPCMDRGYRRTEQQGAAVRLIEAHLRERPDDKPIAELLQRLKAAE